MRVHLLNGISDPVILPATQVVIMQDDGTPISLAAVYGDGIMVEHVQNQDSFNQALQKLGITRTVLCHQIRLPAPLAGSQLIAGPKS